MATDIDARQSGPLPKLLDFPTPADKVLAERT
jgi:hypothetical protein